MREPGTNVADTDVTHTMARCARQTAADARDQLDERVGGEEMRTVLIADRSGFEQCPPIGAGSFGPGL